MRREEARRRLADLGFSDADIETLLAHFEDAEHRGKVGHGYSRVPWLETLDDLDPAARPACLLETAGFERWSGNGALGYLTLATVCRKLADVPPERAKVIVAERCFPTGMLGHYVRRLAEAGLVAVLTATSPARLPHPDGGPPLVGTNPLAIGVPASDGPPVVADVSMGKATYGDVLAGRASAVDLVPFGDEQAHKAFALAVGLQLLVDALVSEPGHGAVLIVARPEADPVPALRTLAGGGRLPGDR